MMSKYCTIAFEREIKIDPKELKRRLVRRTSLLRSAIIKSKQLNIDDELN